jgi:glucuronate isomerase
LVVPTWRPDRAHQLLEDPPAWNAWADQVEARSGVSVQDLDSLLEALTCSYQHFAGHGCRASDHGLKFVPDKERDVARASEAVTKVREGGRVGEEERDAILLEVLHLAARLAFQDDSVLQLHLGARRDVSPRLRSAVGPDAGGDAIGDYAQAAGLARLLGDLDSGGRLPRMVLYNANPRDNALFAAMASAFSRPGVAALVQWGPPWWFNDHERGIRRHLQVLGEEGQLASFVGMLTDSRSVLSMTRHELFRRILCDLIGRDADEGRIPIDMTWLGGIVRDLSAGNTARFFGLPPPRLARWE